MRLHACRTERFKDARLYARMYGCVVHLHPLVFTVLCIECDGGVLGDNAAKIECHRVIVGAQDDRAIADLIVEAAKLDVGWRDRKPHFFFRDAYHSILECFILAQAPTESIKKTLVGGIYAFS